MEPQESWIRTMDRLYHESDRLYYTVARGCGLSASAYWIMYAIEKAGGSASQSELGREYCYSRQTVNSVVKALEERGLVELDFSEGSRRNKDVRLTEAGHAFAKKNVAPAMAAERRAYEALEPAEREELLRLIEKYTRAIVAEIGAVRGEEVA